MAGGEVGDAMTLGHAKLSLILFCVWSAIPRLLKLLWWLR